MIDLLPICLGCMENAESITVTPWLMENSVSIRESVLNNSPVNVVFLIQNENAFGSTFLSNIFISSLLYIFKYLFITKITHTLNGRFK